MLTNLALVLLFLLAPAALVWLTHHQRWAQKIGVIVLCYAAGLLFGNLGLVPESAQEVQNQATEISIALAMPLLLFSLDIRQWRHVAGKALLSMLCATTAVATVASCLFIIFRGDDPSAAANYAAMSVGVYTGGTPNLAAIKAGLEIPHSQYLVFHSLDTVIGSIYLISMLTVGIPFFRRFLRHTPPVLSDSEEQTHHFDSEDYMPLLRRANLGQVVKPLLLASLVVALAAGLSELYAAATGASNSSAVLIVAITTLGIGLSLYAPVRQMHFSYRLGMYLIYVFCFAVSSLASVEQLANVDASVALFLGGAIGGSVLLHFLLCRLLQVDSDTFMVTSVAAVGSPPFVPMMSRALGNPSTLLSGMTTGIIGYALGNYLGISLGLLLRGF